MHDSMPIRAPVVLLLLAASVLAGALIGWMLRGEPASMTAPPPFVPGEARLLDIRKLRTGGPAKVAVSWVRFGKDEPFGVFTVSLWERLPASSSWHPIYTRSVSGSKAYGLHDIRLRTADITLDGRDELVIFEDLDGSAGNYLYRVLKVDGDQVRQLEARLTSTDDTTIIAQPGALISYDGIGKDPKTLAGIHCCPRYWRRTVKRWNGTRLVSAEVTRAETRPLPYPY